MPPISHLVTRTLWLIFGVGVGLYSVMEGVHAHQVGITLPGIGMMLFGIAWFMQPVVLDKPVSTLTASSQEVAIGPPALRKILTLGAFGCLAFGMIARYVIHI
jgi:hypothetical protein